MNSIIREFHPIGQGAFYSEKHDGFNIVYDCGVEWKKRGDPEVDKIIKKSFSDDNEVIDILFISHFDYDHVSKIKNLGEINTVILPLLHDKEKIVLGKILDSIYDSNFSLLINNPKEYFGNKTKIIYIKNSTSIDIDKLNEQKRIHVREIPDGNIIPSGTQLFLPQKNNSTDGIRNDWIFIPYNHEYKKRHTELMGKLKSNKITIKQLSDPLYFSDPKNQKKIKSIYDSLDGKINQNSMLLYSGPDNKKSIYRINTIQGRILSYYNYREYYTRSHLLYEPNVGCIYTGDADLNICDINNIYQTQWNLVGTVQIPHHGDIRSFSDNCNLQGLFCPISFGLNNNYGHPSGQTIFKIINQFAHPIPVTNDNIGFIQEIIFL